MHNGEVEGTQYTTSSVYAVIEALRRLGSERMIHSISGVELECTEMDRDRLRRRLFSCARQLHLRLFVCLFLISCRSRCFFFWSPSAIVRLSLPVCLRLDTYFVRVLQLAVWLTGWPSGLTVFRHDSGARLAEQIIAFYTTDTKKDGKHFFRDSRRSGRTS